MIQECNTCSAGLVQAGDMGLCRAHPPTSSVVVLVRGQVQMEQVPTPISSLPSVPRSGWCREWQAAGSQIVMGH